MESRLHLPLISCQNLTDWHKKRFHLQPIIDNASWSREWLRRLLWRLREGLARRGSSLHATTAHGCRFVEKGLPPRVITSLGLGQLFEEILVGHSRGWHDRHAGVGRGMDKFLFVRLLKLVDLGVYARIAGGDSKGKHKWARLFYYAHSSSFTNREVLIQIHIMQSLLVRHNFFRKWCAEGKG